jgi:hypothetical protein
MSTNALSTISLWLIIGILAVIKETSCGGVE